MNTKQLMDEAISLPVEERAIFADLLLKSLNSPDSNIDKKWSLVAKNRLEQLQSGQVKSIPGDEVFSRIWKRFA